MVVCLQFMNIRHISTIIFFLLYIVFKKRRQICLDEMQFASMYSITMPIHLLIPMLKVQSPWWSHPTPGNHELNKLKFTQLDQ